MNLRRIARHLGVVHQTVANWVAAYAATLPDAPPTPPHDRQHPLPFVELDELYTFERQKKQLRGKKKQRVYLITQVDRVTRCVIAYDVAYDREPERLHALLNTAPSARQYYSDQLAAYTNLVYYPGQHAALPNKSQTYSVEGDNAELRHYLARLVRRSRLILATPVPLT